MNAATVDLLRATRHRLRKPEAWCKRAMARRADNAATSPEDPAACQWCLLGALAKEAADEDQIKQGVAVVYQALRGMPGFQASYIGTYNDYMETDHAAIIDLLDEAIVIAEGTP